MDWLSWHAEYDDPDSPMARRLRVVQERVRVSLAEGPPGPVQVISLCAGQGRDLIEVLAGHPRRRDVRARLVELDPRNAALAARAARSAGLDQVEVVVGDAALTDNYRDVTPADLVLICGLFGNVTDEDILRTIAVCPQLCRTGGVVVWTRHRDAPDRVPLICDWFERRGFERRWLSGPEEPFCVGAHRFTGQPHRLEPGVRMFDFIGYDLLRQVDPHEGPASK